MPLKILAYRGGRNLERADQPVIETVVDTGGKVFPAAHFRVDFHLEHWAWLFLFMNLIRVLQRGTDITGLDPHSTYRILMVVIAGIFIAGMILTRNRLLGYVIKPPLVFMFIFGCAAVVSSLYSSVTFYTAWKALEVVVLTLATAAILAAHQPYKSVDMAYKLTLTLLALVGISPWLWMVVDFNAVWMPSKGILPYMLQGVIPPVNPNTLGALSAMVGIVLVVRYFRGGPRKNIYFLGALFAIFTLILSSSRTSNAAFWVSILTFAYFDKRRKLFLGLLFGIGIVLAVGVVREVVVAFIERGQSAGAMSTLSGRTVVWETAWEYFKQSPYIGHGFAAAGRFDILHGSRSSHLHGSIFEVLVGVGLAGTIPWLMVFIWTGIRLLRPIGLNLAHMGSELQSKRAELLAFLVYLVLRSTTTSQLAAHNMETMLLMCLVAYSMLRWDVRRNTPPP